jgi:allantoinase
MELLAREHGVTSFKIFMFYGSHGLHGASDKPGDFLLLPDGERYDLAHFEAIMRELGRLGDRRLSLSLHCELGEILAAYTKMVQADGTLSGLAAYSASRPPHSEGLAIFIAAYLADETHCLDVNLLHLSSKKAIEAALTMQRVFPHVRFRREVTIGHLLLDVDAKAGNLAKVNPPIRPREDVERLWQAVLAGDVDWVVSDHACCASEQKTAAARPGDVFAAKSGFGGTEWLLSGLYSEGTRRGLSANRVAQLSAWNPAQRFGLHDKGDLAPGYDADLVLFDPAASFTVRAADSPSGQGYTPFEGLELTGRVESTFLRGKRIYYQGRVEGAPEGRYLKRPYGASRA